MPLTQNGYRRRPLPVVLLGVVLAAALSAATVARTLPSDPVRAVDPARAGQQLRAEAERYRQLAQRWRPLDAGDIIRPGDRGGRVAQLRAMLKLYGDFSGLRGPLRTLGTDFHRFDSGLQTAVENYQRRHGLTPTGTADPRTLAELAVPPAERARQLDLNAARWEKLRVPSKAPYVLVNVPDFRLQLIDRGVVLLSMKTVVGKTSSRTPPLRSRITNVIFNPTWTVPRSILLTEMLPKARNNPEAMHKRGYRVVSYGSGDTSPISPDGLVRAAGGRATLRQVSGPGNTLGRVKFVIPNKLAIFLHDTQSQSLFEFRERAFSHGCVRLEQPEELAYALLNKQGWDRTRIALATTGSESINIKVNNPPRLFITYITAWPDNAGRPQFRRDIYHRGSGRATEAQRRPE